MQNPDTTTIIMAVVIVILGTFASAVIHTWLRRRHEAQEVQREQQKRREQEQWREQDNSADWYENELARLAEAQFRMKLDAMEAAKHIMQLKYRS